MVPLLATAIPFFNFSLAQNIKVVKKTKIYSQLIKEDSNYLMIELKDLIPSIQYELQYATPHNFTKKQLYKNKNATFLRLPAAKALCNAQYELLCLGYGLKIYDAYRPYHVTRRMWDLVKDERYVANPARGSGHNRGLSVDLTIIDVATGKELDMGTSFDNFTDTAGHSFTGLPTSVLNNRALLRSLMEKHGFRVLHTEWWHYSWPNDRNYDVLDLDFNTLRNASKPSALSAPSSSNLPVLAP
ncbi:MAG TPA: M15 family metallopeptidase [Chitinophagaceae bacterium]